MLVEIEKETLEEKEEEDGVKSLVKEVIIKVCCLCCCSCCRRKLEELQQEGVTSQEEADLLRREVTTVNHLTPDTRSEVSPEGRCPPFSSTELQTPARGSGPEHQEPGAEQQQCRAQYSSPQPPGGSAHAGGAARRGA